VNALDALGTQLRHEIELLVDARIREALRRRETSKRWLTVAETAAYLGISEAAVRARIKRKRIPVRHSGRSLVIDRVALDRLIEED
jgi:excisionase family DNA binding protein